MLDAATARLAVRLHAVSNTVADVMSAHLRYPRERIDVVPRGRDAARLGERTLARRTAARLDLGASVEDKVVLAVARHEHDKGLDVLVRAMPQILERLPNARLFIAGQRGSRTAALQQFVMEQRLEGVIVLLGARSDVAELLCAADVFVLPSRREGFPGAVLEAMALEAPIVASDIAQVREAVDESCAVLVESTSVGAFASGIERALNEHGATEARAAAARARFLRNFTMQAVAPQMLAFYERALTRES
jgi:glycosyltransferase involved in cell wall biosynthesis